MFLAHNESSRTLTITLASVDHCTAYQKVGGSIPSRGTYLGCRFDPQSGCVWEATNQYFFFTSVFLFLFLSLSL